MEINVTENQPFEALEQESATQNFWCEPVYLAQQIEGKTEDEPSFFTTIQQALALRSLNL